MVLELHEEDPDPPRLGFIRKVFLRAVALFLLIYSLNYWMRIVGLAGDIRFDLMPEHWQVASATLAVLLPVTAVGMWGLYPWGLLTWFLTIAIELTMYAFQTDYFGRNDLVLAFHFVALIAWMAIFFSRYVLTSKPA